MDEALEAAEVVADSELEGAFTWLFRLLGALLVLVGLALWLTGTMELLVFPAALVLVGLALIAAPELLLALAELT